jgi:hypothetical protein
MNIIRLVIVFIVIIHYWIILQSPAMPNWRAQFCIVGIIQHFSFTNSSH